MVHAHFEPAADEPPGPLPVHDDPPYFPPAGVAPPPGAGREDRADWLELRALGRRHLASMEDLLQALRTSPASGDADTRGLAAELGAADAFAELHDRRQACFHGYPFRLAGEVLDAPRNVGFAPYTFLLLLSVFGAAAGPSDLDGASLFEEVCAEAGMAYLGGRRLGARSIVFGAPRRGEPAGFRAAVDSLCEAIGEGGGCRSRLRLRHQRDAKLDVVVWRPFPDGRAGQVIGFGQCATGRGWPAKLQELQPRAFGALWLREPLAVEPLRMFFVPFRVDPGRWEEASFSGGVLFDRCRIAAHAAELPPAVRERCRAWSRHVIRTRLRGVSINTVGA
jgi:hypothetical protein